MTLIIQKPTGAKLVMAQISQTLDADAQAYVNAVEVADGQRIEDPVRFAINNFVIGCKADGIWSAIKASCILAGARTLTGALVPLVGTAPTNVSFVSGDYNRKTGLVGDGSTKYLNSNRNNNADPQNSNHNAVYLTTAPTQEFSVFIGSDVGSTSGGNIIQAGGAASTVNDLLVQNRGTSAPAVIGQGNTLGFKAINRSSSSSYSYRTGGSTATVSTVSAASTSVALLLYATRLSSIAGRSNARLAFYSIGESLDLALLDARVTDLINAFAAAIP
jgi:hypothetical protein